METRVRGRTAIAVTCLYATFITCLLMVDGLQTVSAAAPRVLPTGARPDDCRLRKLKTLNDDFPFETPENLADWERRSRNLRRRILVACGLWPLPPKTPLNPHILPGGERTGFTVERVYFESIPNHFVTGLLFRPTTPLEGKRPAVLSPHGHGGRLQDYGDQGIREQIAWGAERFLESGRNPKLARCAQLARMGCVVFIYDMIGYVDSVQIPGSVAHGLRERRPDMENKEAWGFFSPAAELRLQSIFGLQAWNSVRALDFLCGLPDVDPERVAVTGGSGGGTQTIILGAIDKRPIASFPQGMVSTAMQGGCPCENASLLRVGTGNVELAGLFAPRPMAMTAANDWTQGMMTKGYRSLQKLYTLYGQSDSVLCTDTRHFKHNYNYVTRTLMYHWFNEHLNLGLETPILEADYPRLRDEEVRVWNNDTPAPASGEDYERELLQQLEAFNRELIGDLTPRDGESLEKFQQVVGGAFATLIGRESSLTPLRRQKVTKVDRTSHWEFADIVTATERHEQLPVVSLYPRHAPFSNHVVLWLSGTGKEALFDASGRPIPAVQQLLARGLAVVTADLLGQGEFTTDGASWTEAPQVPTPRAVAAYTTCYNDSLWAQRVHDTMTLIQFIRGSDRAPERLTVVATSGAAPWVAGAGVMCGDMIDQLVLDTKGFSFTHIDRLDDPNFAPGIVKYGGLPGLIAASVPRPTWVLGQPEQSAHLPRAAFAAANGADQLHWHESEDLEQVLAESIR